MALSKNRKAEKSHIKGIEVADMVYGLPVIPIFNTVVFPSLELPIGIQQPELMDLCKEAIENRGQMFCFTVRDNETTGRFRKDFYEYGTLIEVERCLNDKKDGPGILIKSLCAVKIHHSEFIDGIMYFDCEKIPFKTVENPSVTEFFDEGLEELRKLYLDMLSFADGNQDMIIKTLDTIGKNQESLINFMCMNSPVSVEQKIQLLKETSLFERVLSMKYFLAQSMKMFGVRKEIHDKTVEDLGEMQRRQYLQSQMQVIRKELDGTEDDEIDELAMRADQMKWSLKVSEHFDKELRKLERFSPTTPEYGIQYSYLETMLDLPWDVTLPENYRIPSAEKQLNDDHYGLKEVKELILEHLAVQKQRKDMKAPIICLVGPPGVGKTSLGKSIAKAMGREYSRISLGGIHDEAEIRGHRKTYIGAMPGRIISALRKMKSNNPVFVLDEIDKMNRDIKGDPSAALLELLDPEQNNAFHDNYLDVDYDLSRVMFIATANDLSDVSRPLLDRMEIIRIEGYSREEKAEIAKRHLVSKVLQANGFKDNEITFSDKALYKIIDGYTKESGVRGLEKKLNKVLRKVALRKSLKKKYPTRIDEKEIVELLGNEDFIGEIYTDNHMAGIVTGLAWTSVGGEVLYIETSLSRAKTPKLTLTGSLGDVMKESAVIALQYLKANSAHLLDMKQEILDSYDVHIHVPEGAVPKDGPSAGITILTSIASAFTRRKVKSHIAMTGEITLLGKVIPVGGIKEKILAAKRADVKEVILCEKNRKDIEKIDPEYLSGLSFLYVERADEVLRQALTDEIDETLPEREAFEEPKKKD